MSQFNVINSTDPDYAGNAENVATRTFVDVSKADRGKEYEAMPVSRQYQKSKGEVYDSDASRFTERAPEPKYEQDADDHEAAAYASSCETALNNQNLDALASGGKLKNIEQIAEGM